MAKVSHKMQFSALRIYYYARFPFNPEKFIGKGWSIDEQVSQRTGNNLDAGNIVGKNYLEEGESSINGEERLKRIKAAGEQDLQLDDQDFLALWQEKSHKTLNWLYEAKGISWLSFWGIILRDPYGSRDVLVLCRHEGGSWSWRYSWLAYVSWHASGPSAVLASS